MADDPTIRALVHDLRTPVTIIDGFAQLLLDRDDELGPELKRDYLQRIADASADLRRMLDDV